jgi:predicted deacetylase
MPKFLIRLDDIHPRMNHDNFDRLINLLSKYTIQGILGVIPDNQDPKLMIQNEDLNFWNQVKVLEDKGYWIAQHGYQHIYDSNDGGILNLNKQSEFAGHSHAIQKDKMEAGKKILEQKGFSPTLFMAPSHSFDQTTLNVARELNYAITDGFGLWPKIKRGLLFIPQLFASPFHLGFGLYTICLHTDVMKEKDFVRLEEHLRKNNNHYITPEELSQYTLQKKQYFLHLLDQLVGILLRYLLQIKRKFLS